MDVIVDDHLLLEVLLDREPADLRDPGAQLFTTGLWYHRLCRALSVGTVTGALSRSLGFSDPTVAIAAIGSVTAVPEAIGLVSLRTLAWPMARLLDEGVRLNLMSLEALAAAEHLRAELCLAEADANPQLLTAAAARGRPTRVLHDAS